MTVKIGDRVWWNGIDVEVVAVETNPRVRGAQATVLLPGGSCALASVSMFAPIPPAVAPASESPPPSPVTPAPKPAPVLPALPAALASRRADPLPLVVAPPASTPDAPKKAKSGGWRGGK